MWDDNLLLNSADTSVKADILIHHLYGAMDSGNAGRGLIEHLVETLPGKTVAEFDPDQLIDYRSHRPWLGLENWRFEGIDLPVISLELLSDDNDTNFLVLHGPEPDAKWIGFVDTVTELAVSAEVKMTVGMHGMPAAVPHTRPTPVHFHGSNHDRLPAQPRMHGSMALPAGMDQLLEYHLGQNENCESYGMIAAVPYYLAEGEYPPAAAALLQALTNFTGLALPVGDVEAAAMVSVSKITSMIEQYDEAPKIVEMLEEHFDEAKPSIIQTPEEPLPTADELGARLEEFLARSDRKRGLKLSHLDGEAPTADRTGLNALRDVPHEEHDIKEVKPRRARHRLDTPEDD